MASYLHRPFLVIIFGKKTLSELWVASFPEEGRLGRWSLQKTGDDDKGPMAGGEEVQTHRKSSAGEEKNSRCLLSYLPTKSINLLLGKIHHLSFFKTQNT